MEYRKLSLILLVGLLFPLVNAELPPFKQGFCGDIIAPLNSTSVNISAIYYPNNTIADSNQIMTLVAPGTFNYSFCNTIDEGKYRYIFYDIDNAKVYGNTFTVTYTGEVLTNEESLLYLGLITIFILFMLFTIWVIGKLPSGNQTDEGGLILKVNWLKYLRLPLWGLVYLMVFAILWYSSNLSIAYLGGFIGSLLFSISIMIGLSGIVIFIVMILKLIDDLWNDRKIQGYLKHGIDAQ